MLRKLFRTTVVAVSSLSMVLAEPAIAGEMLYDTVSANAEEGIEEIAESVSQVEVDGFTISTHSDGTASVIQYSGLSDSVVIPETVKELGITYTVNTINDNVFKDNLLIKKVEISKNIKNLGKSVFTNCKNLSEVVIKGNILSVSDHYNDEHADFYAAGQQVPEGIHVIFAEGVEIIPVDLFATTEERLRERYAKVTKLTLPSTLKSIGSHAFYSCYDLKEVNWNGAVSLEKIGSNAFEKCSSIEQVEIPNNRCEVSERAFYECLKIKKVVMNGGVLGKSAFAHCRKLSEFTINGNIADADSSSTNYTSYPVFYCAGQDNENGFKVYFGEGVELIPAYLFATPENRVSEKYAKVTEVNIPLSVTKIGQKAFYNCHSLSAINYQGTMSQFSNVVNSLDYASSQVNYETYNYSGNIDWPVNPTVDPAATNSPVPTNRPTATPTNRPTATPTNRPTATTTNRPTATPTNRPTATTTNRPTPTPVKGSVIVPDTIPNQLVYSTPTPTPNVNDNVIRSVGEKKTVLAGDSLYVDIPGVDLSVIKVKGKGVTYSAYNGRVTTSGKGKASLYYMNGSKKAVLCSIKIEQPKLKKTLKVNLHHGKKLKVSGTKFPVERWFSFNPYIATIDSNGLVGGMGTGVTTVGVVIRNHVYLCNVVVKDGKIKVRK